MSLPRFLAALLPLALAAADAPLSWTPWRGPGGQGVAADENAPLVWGEKQNLLWKVPLPGPGNSTPVAWNGRLFLTSSGQGGQERRVLCVKAHDGSVLWENVAAAGVTPEKVHNWNGFASASCATDGEVVVAFFASAGLHCYDLDGKLLWKHHFGLFTSDRGWGSAASPFLFENLVIQNCDNAGAAVVPPGVKPADIAPAALVALDKRTGKEVWRTPRDQGIGFGTPVLVPMPDGRKDLVLNGPHGVWAYDPKTGRERWHVERHVGENDALYGEPTPVFTSSLMVALSGRPGPMQAIRLSHNDGDLTKSHIAWDVKRKGSRDVASPVIVGETLYLADTQGQLSAHDLKSGEQLFRERTSGAAKAGSGGRTAGSAFVASPVLLRGKLLFLREDGTTFVVEPGPKLNVVGRNVLSDGTEFRASPVVLGGRIYLRSQANLYAVGTK
jgi:outer membrane protein assembly factor BamB